MFEWGVGGVVGLLGEEVGNNHENTNTECKFHRKNGLPFLLLGFSLWAHCVMRKENLVQPASISTRC